MDMQADIIKNRLVAETDRQITDLDTTVPAELIVHRISYFLVAGQFVFALYQLTFRFRPPAYFENYLLSPFLDVWAGRYQPTTEDPDDPEQKQTDPPPFSLLF